MLAVDSGTSYEARGHAGRVHTNAFAGTGGHSYRSIRSMGVARGENNLTEWGWMQENQTYIVFRVVRVNGDYRERRFNFGPSPNSDHTFKVHDSNADYIWSFAYDGAGIENVTTNMRKGLAYVASEVHCRQDSAWAHFWNLDSCANIGCAWRGWRYMDAPYYDENPRYYWQKVSNTEVYVQLA